MNIILLIMDTVRKNNLTPYGYDRETTPFLSELSESSIVYENAVSQSPWTLPSHASMFTGKYPSEHGATQESPFLSNEDTVATKLSEDGYNTGLFSANAWISPHTGLTAGFDETSNFFGPLPNRLEGHMSKLWRRLNTTSGLEWVANKLVKFGNVLYERKSTSGHESYTPSAFNAAKDFIDDSTEEYFVCLNLLDAHLPYNPPLENLREFGSYDKRPSICQNSKEYNSGMKDISDDEWGWIRDMYDAELNYLDSQINNFYAWLERENELDDTVFIVCSDHGELLGEHGIYGHEFAVYSELINVPLIINHPDMGTDRRNEIVEMIDIHDTLLDIADIQMNNERSLFSDDYRKSIQYQGTAFCEYSRPLIELEQLRTKARKSSNEIDTNSRYDSRMYAAMTRNQNCIKNENIENEIIYFNKSDASSSDDIFKKIDKYNRVGGVGDGESPGKEAIDDSIKDRLEELGYLE